MGNTGWRAAIYGDDPPYDDPTTPRRDDSIGCLIVIGAIILSSFLPVTTYCAVLACACFGGYKKAQRGESNRRDGPAAALFIIWVFASYACLIGRSPYSLKDCTPSRYDVPCSSSESDWGFDTTLEENEGSVFHRLDKPPFQKRRPLATGFIVFGTWPIYLSASWLGKKRRRDQKRRLPSS
jgi:hypothetical protein